MSCSSESCCAGSKLGGLDYMMELASDPWILNVAFLSRPIKALATDCLRTFALTCRPKSMRTS